MSIFLFRSRAFVCGARRTLFVLLVAVVSLSALAAAESYLWLGLPVGFKNKEYAFRSGPAVALQKVQIQTVQPIQMEHVWLMPDWGVWLSEFNTHSVRAEADEVVATPVALMRLGLSDGPSSRRITRLHFERLKLVLAATTLDLPAGDMEFSADATLSRVRINLEGGVQIMFAPGDGKLGLAVQTERLSLNALPALLFDNVLAQGTIDEDGIVLNKIGASGDGGAVSGALNVSLAADKASVTGDLEFKGLRIKNLLDRAYPRHVLDGSLNGNMKIKASAPTLVGLKDAPTQMSGNFTLKAGSIDRFGLLEGMRRNDSGVVGGGLVRYDVLNGSFSGATGAKASVSFSDLNNGALQGRGRFTVSPEGNLSGAIGGSLRLPNNDVVTHNFALEGKVSAPVLVRH